LEQQGAYISKDGSTEAGIIRIGELGLDAMEVEFVHGVRMKEEKALLVGKVAEQRGIALPVMLPITLI
jgi:deoxyribonuclease-4